MWQETSNCLTSSSASLHQKWCYISHVRLSSHLETEGAEIILWMMRSQPPGTAKETFAFLSEGLWGFYPEYWAQCVCGRLHIRDTNVLANIQINTFTWNTDADYRAEIICYLFSLFIHFKAYSSNKLYKLFHNYNRNKDMSNQMKSNHPKLCLKGLYSLYDNDTLCP